MASTSNSTRATTHDRATQVTRLTLQLCPSLLRKVSILNSSKQWRRYWLQAVRGVAMLQNRQMVALLHKKYVTSKCVLYV